MGVSFYLGRSGSGKSTAILQEIQQKLAEEPAGRPIIYLVPDQMTFQSEYQLVKSAGGMVRAQVFSFSRLAWRVLQETGGAARYHLEQTGIHMLLRKIVEREKERFSIFTKSTETSGFIEQLEQMVAECKRYAVTPEALVEKKRELEAKENVTPQERVLIDKLDDVSVIFKRMEEELAGAYVGTEDYLQLLTEKIQDSSFVENAEVYIDGFHSFTPQELAVLDKLMAKASNVTIALTLDKPYDIEAPHELDLFHMTAQTYQTLRQLCKETSCEVEDVVTFESGQRFRESCLAHLENSYEARPLSPASCGDAVHIFSAVHRRAEVEGVAREVLRLVREEGYRYQDIAILLRNINEYGDLLDTVFTDYEIPLFMDQKRSMLNHPVIELIRSSLEVIQGNWRYEAVFRCFKTDLLFPYDAGKQEMREEVDELENYVLAYGIQGKRWRENEPWTYSRFRTLAEGEFVKTDKEQEFENQINRLRRELTVPLLKLERKIKKAETIEEKCTALYLFLEELEVPKKLEKMRDEAAQAGDLAYSREHDQVWGAVIDLLDQMVEMAGNERLSFKMFQSMLDSGAESMRFALVPPAMDQVIVADMERSRLSQIKCTFIMNVNDGVIPARPDEDGLINDEERGWLESTGMELAPGSTRQLLDEQFLSYLAQATPSEKLYYSYPMADEEGRALQPSMLIKRVKELFPDVEETLLMNDPHEEEEDQQLAFISNPGKTLSYLTTQMQAWKKGYPMAPFWWDIYNWYTEIPHWRMRAGITLSSLFYQNTTRILDRKTSMELYGQNIKTSVSRMEQHQSCAFSQFVSYGLSLKERDTYRLEAPDVGQLFHAALKQVADHLRLRNKDWAALSKEESRNLAKEVVNELAPKIQREILLSSNRHYYLKEKLEEVVSRASIVLSEQSKISGFSPVGLEVGFGPGEELPPLRFSLDNGAKMEVVGRIDRVDKTSGEDGLLLRIIDYKSSQKDISLTDVYFGLALQMLIYLDVVISFSEEWLGKKADPAGVLYFHVHNPIVQATQTMSMEEIERELFKKFKMKGLLTADEHAIREMDKTLESGHSQIIPVGLKKNGGFYSNSSIIDPDDYEYLRTFLRKQVKEIGESITSGHVEINPFKVKQNTSCTFCSYKSVCQFDPAMETNDFRPLAQYKEDKLLEMIRKKGGDNDES
ncbi:helicase-exonuclease AddAB subunit AddB [Bacillus sp. FJAT-44742]|uniref:helicase-exonuclease AddAB subunit AddB n=1 Tax=Bacillus sp. FJAT-44742 TaxID=2014005 RepID=UPI000C23FC33|nr:helicase-exonuclease AddAB subunit AddB [Bacillus sp. FJAT-44742]